MTDYIANIMSENFEKFAEENGIQYWKHKEQTIVAVLKQEAREIILYRCELKNLKKALPYGVKFGFGVDVQLEDLLDMIID